jgi:vacuolar-type H+-ATPase subunit I/STV1
MSGNVPVEPFSLDFTLAYARARFNGAPLVYPTAEEVDQQGAALLATLREREALAAATLRGLVHEIESVDSEPLEDAQIASLKQQIETSTSEGKRLKSALTVKEERLKKLHEQREEVARRARAIKEMASFAGKPNGLESVVLALGHVTVPISLRKDKDKQ